MYEIGEVRVASSGQEILSVVSQSDLFKCISYIPMWPLQVYQSRPGLSTPSMTSCVPRLVRNCISYVPSFLLLAYYCCPESWTARVWFASKNMCIQNVEQFEGSYTVLLNITLYTIICTHTEVLNDIDNAQMLYRVTVYCLSPLVKENNLLGEKTGTLPS
jgi:hypothetical protein